MENRTFLKQDKQLNRSTTLTNTITGQVVNLSSTEKQLYTWFLDRYEFWKSLGKVFHDNQDFIAQENGVSERTIKRFLKDFVDVGVIDKGVGNGAGGSRNSNNYVVVNVFTNKLFTLDGKQDNYVTAAKPVKSAEKPQYSTITKKDPWGSKVSDELDDLPF